MLITTPCPAHRITGIGQTVHHPRTSHCRIGVPESRSAAKAAVLRLKTPMASISMTVLKPLSRMPSAVAKKFPAAPFTRMSRRLSNSLEFSFSGALTPRPASLCSYP